MVLRPRTRLQLRRAAFTAALGALLVPATAGAAAKTPVISKVTPKSAYVGTTLTIKGKYFLRGKGKNSVLFRRDHGKALFVKANVSTTKRLTVVVPKTLEKYMLVQKGAPVATRFRLRILTTKLSKAYTSAKASPVIGPERANSGNGQTSGGAGVPTSPDGDCDGDGVKNGAESDDDNDLLSDTQEVALLLDPCVGDTDFDGVEDGYEYQSAMDLNDDDYQHISYITPFPGKTPYPNPLFSDAGTDYDGDGLSLATEYKLWKYTYEVNHTASRALAALSYSDGMQFSLSGLNGTGRRVPTMSRDLYQPPQTFRGWANPANYGVVALLEPDAGLAHAESLVDLYDMDRDTVVTQVATDNQLRSEYYYWDLDNNAFVSDDERDEDADGLTNFDENTGRMTAGWWAACYSGEGAYPIAYAGTLAFDADSDGDGVLDGADDQDFDDVPNIMELSRNMAGNRAYQGSGCVANPTAISTYAPAKTWVQPFNPCLPDRRSRTCERHPGFAGVYPPFDSNWKPLVLN